MRPKVSCAIAVQAFDRRKRALVVGHSLLRLSHKRDDIETSTKNIECVLPNFYRRLWERGLLCKVSSNLAGNPFNAQVLYDT